MGDGRSLLLFSRARNLSGRQAFLKLQAAYCFLLCYCGVQQCWSIMPWLLHQQAAAASAAAPSIKAAAIGFQ